MGSADPRAGPFSSLCCTELGQRCQHRMGYLCHQPWPCVTGSNVASCLLPLSHRAGACFVSWASVLEMTGVNMAANVVVTINACSAEHVVKMGPDSMLYPRLLENMFPLSAPSAGMHGLTSADVKNGLAL